MVGKQVVVRIKPDGTTTVAAEGFAGDGCLEATKPYEDKLGRVVDDKPTAEAYMPAVADERAEEAR